MFDKQLIVHKSCHIYYFGRFHHPDSKSEDYNL